MRSVSVDKSTLTDRYQTTVPASVRKALNLNKQEKIKYEIRSDGSVLLSKYDDEEIDPVIGEFLDFLEADMKENPQKLQPASQEFATKIKSLVGNIDIDLDDALSEE